MKDKKPFIVIMTVLIVTIIILFTGCSVYKDETVKHAMRGLIVKQWNEPNKDTPHYYSIIRVSESYYTIDDTNIYSEYNDDDWIDVYLVERYDEDGKVVESYIEYPKMQQVSFQ